MLIKFLKFQDLSTSLLYEIMKLRFNTFVLEQNSLYEEFDDIDYKATHVLFEENEKLIAYLRIYSKRGGVVSFGRVVVAPEYRKRGYGREIVEKALEYIEKEMNIDTVEIEAQEYLKEFYSSFGFVQTSQPFDDCGVSHIEMRKEF